MVSTTYTSGSWLGIVRSGSIIVLEGDTHETVVAELWDFLGQRPGINGVLNEVTSKFGTDLTGMPAFAIVVQSDRLHAILRGDITLLAHSANGTETVSGRDVTTWSERSLPLADSIQIDLEDADAGERLVLPLGEGVVRLRSLDVVSALTGMAPLISLVPEAAVPEADVHEAEVHEADVQDAAVLDEDAEVEPEPALAEPYEHESHHENPEDHPDDVPVVDPVADAAALASFAKAAEAADAEWNAQLAPLVEADDGAVEHDLNLTIRPALGEDEEHGEPVPADDQIAQAPEQDQDTDAYTDTAHGVAEAVTDAVDDGFTTNYDFLFGDTQIGGSVESAAVRLDENGQPVETAAEQTMPPRPAQPPATGSSDAVAESADELAAEPADGAAQAAAPVAQAEPAWEVGPANGLIDFVPWASPAGPLAPTADVAPAADAAPGAEAAQDSAQAYDPDHDGHTVMRGDFAQDAQSHGQPQAPEVDARPSTGPLVLARVCPNGHANPPSHSLCSDCGATINSEPREVGRPRLGTMHISTGEVVELDHSLIIGRQPSVSRVMGGAMPRLVQVKSGNGDISRSHVEVRLDGWDVMLVDLKATNGTVLVREGQAPRRLSQGEEAILLNGDIAELGDGVSLLFDGLL